MKKLGKKLLLFCISLALCCTLSTAVQAAGTIVVGASPTPHAEILTEAAKLLKAQGYKLKIVDYSDYVQPNVALDSKDLDANYFQHKPYLDDFNAQKGTKLESLGPVHYEPFGIYAGRTKSLKDLKEGALVAVPNDATNEGRALLLLEAEGFITLKKEAGLTATRRDIVENPKKLRIEEIEAAQLVRALPDVDIAIINGNYAILGGLKVADALAVEKADSVAASTYANIVAVRQGDAKRADLQALYKALTSPELAAFMQKKYSGAVLPSVK
ncbi:MAG: MetQ/NlpA family ABC transporter substrate-binding protein [Desulfovibrio sp.]|nr:MetQ/NlpA family ABC transporter substrate-binding protein [Desulfovibrio sp.]